MWKFKAFCLDYWHVLCLHPHNNFYKRYVCVCVCDGGIVSHSAVTFLLFWRTCNYSSAASLLMWPPALGVLHNVEPIGASENVSATRFDGGRDVSQLLQDK